MSIKFGRHPAQEIIAKLFVLAQCALLLLHYGSDSFCLFIGFLGTAFGPDPDEQIQVIKFLNAFVKLCHKVLHALNLFCRIL